MARVSLIGVEHGQRGDGFFRTGIEFNGSLEFAFGFLHVVVEAIEAAEKKVIVHAIGVELHDLFVLIDSELQNVVRTVATGHVAERAEINAAQKFVGFKILGIALDDVLSFFDSVSDTAGLHVELGEGGGQEFGRGVGVDGQTVFFGRLRGEVAASIGRDHFLVHVRHRVVVISSGLVDFTRRRRGGLGVRLGGICIG